jgi:hypothetical protein
MGSTFSIHEIHAIWAIHAICKLYRPTINFKEMDAYMKHKTRSEETYKYI